MWPSPCVSETDVVVFPSPAFVGVIAVTQTSFPSGESASRSSDAQVDLGLVAAVRLDLVGEQPGGRGDLADRPQRGVLGDLERGRHRRGHGAPFDGPRGRTTALYIRARGHRGGGREPGWRTIVPYHEPMAVEATGSQAVDRAAELLVRIMESEQPPSVGELAVAAACRNRRPRGLLRALESRGLVQRDGARGSLRPGSVLLRYARRAGRGGDLVELTAPALSRARRADGRDRERRVAGPAGVEHLAQRDSRFFLGSSNWIGRPVPFHAAANGQGLPRPSASARLPRGALEQFTEHTVVDRDALELELAPSGERGWATAVEELEPGLLAVAAPGRDGHGDVSPHSAFRPRPSGCPPTAWPRSGPSSRRPRGGCPPP